MKATVLLLFALVLALGCGDNGDRDDEGSPSEESAVLRTIDAANETFALGQYERTCTYYTETVQKELASLVRARSCPQAWEVIGRMMRRSLTPAQFEAVTNYGAETAKVDGDIAEATYGDPPEALPLLLGPTEGATVELRKEAERWLIASLPD